MNLLLIALALLILPACAGLPQTVDVPVAVPCQTPPVTARPRLAIRDIRPESPPDEVAKAYATTLEQLGGYAAELEQIIKGYSK